MPRTNFNDLLDAGVHFGHLKRKWNPAMAPFIFMERNGIHIIDLQKTQVKIEEAANAIKQIAKSGRKVLFVATKKQAKDIVAERIKQINMPYVTERWPGGMLTNFPTIRKAVKKMTSIDKMMTDGTFDTLSKRERLQVTRQRAKLEKNLGSIADLTRLPAAMFVVDISKEHIAVREARRLSIPVFAMVDTNSNPNYVDFPIPANDDASKSISLIIDVMAKAIEEGLEERKMEKEKEGAVKDKKEGEGKKSKARKSKKDEIEEGELMDEESEDIEEESEELREDEEDLKDEIEEEEDEEVGEIEIEEKKKEKKIAKEEQKKETKKSTTAEASKEIIKEAKEEKKDAGENKKPAKETKEKNDSKKEEKAENEVKEKKETKAKEEKKEVKEKKETKAKEEKKEVKEENKKTNK